MRVVSGGQTGVDRAALDWAIGHGVEHGGWCPVGRISEDGVIPPHYALTELATGGYRQRTKRNVFDNDATLVVNMGALDGGTLATVQFAQRAGKPILVVQLDHVDDVPSGASQVAQWLNTCRPMSLNVAGPRESKRPGITVLSMRLLDACFCRHQA